MEVKRYTNNTIAEIELPRPFDGHGHPRRDELLRLVGPMMAKRFASGIVMPNTKPPITSRLVASEYRDDILHSTDHRFSQLMTLYLTDTLDPAELNEMRTWGIYGVKYYPKGLTTNSDSGVFSPSSLWTPGTNAFNVLRKLAEEGGVLLLHAADGFDKNNNELDPYDQEPHFIRESLPRVKDAHPDLKISVEHLSTAVGAEFMFKNGGYKLGCSITLHHLTKDRRDVFRGGFRPHLMWWPIIQPAEHKEAIQALAIADKRFVWLGTDSAPHPVSSKRADCCMGGVLTHHMALEGYVEAFEDLGALDDRFERFASINGPKFFGFPPSIKTITLVREDWTVKNSYLTEGLQEEIIPFRYGETMRWKIQD